MHAQAECCLQMFDLYSRECIDTKADMWVRILLPWHLVCCVDLFDISGSAEHSYVKHVSHKKRLMCRLWAYFFRISASSSCLLLETASCRSTTALRLIIDSAFCCRMFVTAIDLTLCSLNSCPSRTALFILPGVEWRLQSSINSTAALPGPHQGPAVCLTSHETEHRCCPATARAPDV